MDEAEVRKIVADAIREFAEKHPTPSKADVEMLVSTAQKAERQITSYELRRFGAMMQTYQIRYG